MKKAVVLYSGGLDSAVALFKCKNSREVYPLRIDTRSRQCHRESRATNLMMANQGLSCIESDLSLPWLDEHPLYTPETLFYSLDSPIANWTDLNSSRLKVVERSVLELYTNYIVPVRNLIFLSIATSYAAQIGAEEVWVGFDYPVDNEVQAPPPDLETDFVKKYQNLITGLTTNKIRIVNAVEGLRKAEIITEGCSYNLPFELTWSCYNDLPFACGVCPSCVRRQEAFKECGLQDHLKYHTIEFILDWLHEEI